jgi:predicted amidohydrolase
MSPKALPVSCVQTDWAKSLESNLSKTLLYIKMAAEYGSRVVLFPEANLKRPSSASLTAFLWPKRDSMPKG